MTHQSLTPEAPVPGTLNQRYLRGLPTHLIRAIVTIAFLTVLAFRVAATAAAPTSGPHTAGPDKHLTRDVIEDRDTANAPPTFPAAPTTGPPTANSDTQIAANAPPPANDVSTSSTVASRSPTNGGTHAMEGDSSEKKSDSSTAPAATAAKQPEPPDPGTDSAASARGKSPATPPPDEFSWLEDSSNPNVKKWVMRRNAETLATLEGDPRYQRYYQRLLGITGIVEDRDFALAPGGRTLLDHGWVYQKLTNADHPRGLWRRTRLDELLERRPHWQTLLDVDALAREESQEWGFYAGGISPDGRRCLIGLSHGGSSNMEVREFDLDRASFVAGGFKATWSGGMFGWRDDDTVVFVAAGSTGVEKNADIVTVRAWSRGTPLAEAQTIFAGEIDDNQLVLSMNDGLSVAQTAGNTDKDIVRAVTVLRIDRDHVESWWQVDGDDHAKKMTLPSDAFPVLYGDQYIVKVRKGDWVIGGKIWKEGSYVSIPFSEVTLQNPSIRLMMEPKPETVLQPYIYRTGAGILLVSETLGQNQLWRAQFKKGQWNVSSVGLPEHGLIGPVAWDPASNTALIQYENHLTPPTLYQLDVKRRKTTVLHARKSVFNSEGIAVERLEAKSIDGASVPYYILRPRDLKFDGQAPTIVHSYGDEGVSSMSPSYQGTAGTLWLTAGGVYVQAGIRGGSERGSEWAVTGADRTFVYSDMVAVLEDLAQRKITTPKLTAIHGHSAGGLMVGAVMTQRPDLMQGVIIEAGLLDQLRWYSEDYRNHQFWGSLEDPKISSLLKRTSPFQNLKRSATFPLPFILTSTTDDNVPPKNARRFAAKMESLGMPYMFYEAPEGGHSLASTPEQAARRDALEYVYLKRLLMDSVKAGLK